MMSPGMLTSRQQGGFGFGFRQHAGNYGQRFGGPVANRLYGAQSTQQRGKFYVDDAGRGHLEPSDRVVLEVDDDGGVSIALEPPKNGNGSSNGENGNGKRRSMFGRRHKMAVSTDNNGEITVRPEADGSLEIVGDPLSGAITIIELFPEPLNGGNGD